MKSYLIVVTTLHFNYYYFYFTYEEKETVRDSWSHGYTLLTELSEWKHEVKFKTNKWKKMQVFVYVLPHTIWREKSTRKEKSLSNCTVRLSGWLELLGPIFWWRLWGPQECILLPMNCLKSTRCWIAASGLWESAHYMPFFIT